MSPQLDQRPNFLRRIPRKEEMGRRFRLALWVAGAGFILYTLLLGEGGWIRVARLQGEVESLEGELRVLDQQQAQLRQRLDGLAQPGSATLEKVARERYGMHRKGERVIHILGTEDESLAPRAPSLDPGSQEPPPPGSP